MSSIITINGRAYQGNSVSVRGNQVIIDGVKQDMPEEKNITISIEGNVNTLSVDSCDKVRVTGSVGTLKTMSGDVKCGDVDGDVKTMSGDVKCSDVAGKIKTMSGYIDKRLL